PLLTATVSESARRGWRAGPLLVLGHGILESTLVVALLFGLAPFVNRDGVVGTISCAGGVILIWMAVGMIRGMPTLTLDVDRDNAPRGRLVLAGVLMSLANPYWTVWWATIGLGLVLQARRLDVWGVIFFFIGHITADLVWYTIVSTAVGTGRRLMTDRVYRRLIAVCAAVLIAFAFIFLYSGVQKLII
ncbi:MAG: LysE family transporter, partial [Candidatus Hydrogenedentes bacterium]|nr:LysE family transporter [Candidatus Hydrogenedentota bacterium]